MVHKYLNSKALIENYNALTLSSARFYKLQL